ncbi:MAG TPA: adenylate kinase [Chloroflexota bacterium]|nr:adenylate kinase [Chloroflexota bacterium]
MPLNAERRPQVILLFGGPAAGKGTQAALLSDALGFPHISSGDLLRDHPQVRAAQAVMDHGDLLPDDVVSEVVFARLAESDVQLGAVLDGFPRTLSQAEALDAWLRQRGGAIGTAFYLEVPREQMIERVVSRGELSHRGDDHADVARRRVTVFLQELPPVLDHYTAQGLVHRVDGMQSIDAVHRQIMAALEKPAASAH